MKKIYCILLAFIFILSGCTRKKNTVINQISEKNNNKVLLSQIKQENIKLYADKPVTNGDYSNLIFNIKRKTKTTNWTNINLSSFYPSLFYKDISGDNKNDNLTAYVGMQISPTSYIGQIVAEYQYINNSYTIKKITFKDQVD